MLVISYLPGYYGGGAAGALQQIKCACQRNAMHLILMEVQQRFVGTEIFAERNLIKTITVGSSSQM